MEKLTNKNITRVVSQTFADTSSERLAEIYQSLVRHLHDFAREVSLTPAEWIAGLGFLTAVGQKCTDKRQEFILLSDVLGLSALVNLLHNGQFTEEGSPPSLVGPFYREGVPTCENGTCIARRTAGGRMARFEGEVVDLQGRPLPGVMVEVWHASADGAYDTQSPTPDEVDLRGRFITDQDGRFSFRTVTPLGYTIPVDGPVGALLRSANRHAFRPAHIHFLIGMEGCHELTTALYLEGDPHLDSDTVFGVSAPLIVQVRHSREPGQDDLLQYRFTYAGEAAHSQSGRVGADPARVMPREAAV
jgi:hydroxyquinol 1,2-dioxygenase